MKVISTSVLTDAETLEMLNCFYVEALQFLGVPKDKWAVVKIGFVFGLDGKADVVPYIDYANAKILVCLPAIKLMLQMNPVVTNDSPSVYRSNGYKLARMWQQYINDGLQRDFLTDKDSWDFAIALSLLKGINYADVPKASAEITKALTGFEVLDINAALRMLRDEFGIDCKVSQATDMIHKVKRAVVTLTDGERQKRADELKSLYDESINIPLPKIEDGQLGSRNNPFQNVDDAAAYILQIEQERLAADPYRQAISDEQYFFDIERGFFRVPWASANVSYYSLEGAPSSCFVVNQLGQRQGHHNEMPRFSIKPSLAHNKFLYRGQSQFYEICVPSLFRNKDNMVERQFVSDIIQMNELEVLLRQHPLVQLFESGFYLLHDFFRFKVDYEGLSQHYYNNTSKLDLTSDMEVAKFFAVTWFDMEADRYEKYTGTELGVLYYYDLAPDAFTERPGRSYLVETIGKQPFMRSGNQSGFLTRVALGENFNDRPEVRYVFFRHDSNITNRIFAESENGDKYMPQEMLRTHWYNRMHDEIARKEISTEALKLNFENNPHVSHRSIVKELRKRGFHISTKNRQCFSDEELNLYYAGVLDFWDEFCSNIHIYSPEGTLLQKHLKSLPKDPRYRWAFYR